MMNARKFVRWIGIGWGIILLVIGFFASFSLGARDTILSVVGFFLLFFLPIVSSIAARWIPRIAGSVLLVAAAAVLTGIYIRGGIMDVFQALSRIYLWFHVIFGVLFIAFARFPYEPRADGPGPPMGSIQT